MQVQKTSGFNALSIVRYTLISIIIGTLLSSIISTFIIGLNTGNWDDFARATGGRLLNSDRDSGLTTDKLLDVKANPQNYDSIDVDSLKNRLLINLGIFVVLFILLFKLGLVIWDNIWQHSVNFVTYIVISVFIIGFMAFLQVGWLVYESKAIDNMGYTDKIHYPEAVPFYGTFHFFSNLGVYNVKGTKEINFNNKVIQTNDTIINPNIVTIIDRG